MNALATWETVLLYLLFVPRKDRHYRTIPQRRFDRLRARLERKLKAGLPGFTEIKFRDAVGFWEGGKEDVLLVFHIAVCDDEAAARVFLEGVGRWIKRAFDQKDVRALRWLAPGLSALKVVDYAR